MLPKSDDKTPKHGPRMLGRRSLLATLGIAAGVAAIVAPGGPAHAAPGDPQPGLLAKIQIATSVTYNRTTILNRAQRTPSLNRAKFRALP